MIKEGFDMTVERVLNFPFVEDGTLVYIRDESFKLLVCSFRVFPQMTRWWPFDVKSFSWDDDNDLYITLKGMG